MECNKEEALRAKGIAENKMQNADFSGAHKIALKAQKLYSELENVSQMLVVCDVHCAADKKFGNESDWYSILQVEQTADEVTIKKQYRKLALQLHPDKNKFPGAEAAFKLIGEAQRVLLDKGKRSVHDIKRRGSGVPYRPQPNPSWPSNVKMQNNVKNNFAGVNPQQPPAQQGYNSNGRPTFWTICPFCSVKYQYYKDILHKTIKCQNCTKTFVAYEYRGTEAPRPPNPTQQRSFPNQGGGKTEQGHPANAVPENSKPPQPGVASAVGVEKTSSSKKRKQVAKSSESSFESASSDDVVMDKDRDCPSKHNADVSGGQSRRRSERLRQNVSYKENLSDDDNMSPAKKTKGSGSARATDEIISNAPETSKQSDEAAGVEEHEVPKQEENVSFEKIIPNGKEHDDKMNGKKTTAKGGCDNVENVDADPSSESNAKEQETLSYPDADFNDFNKNTEEECFAAGQTWAVYDTLDAMPRFYAQIRKVFSRGFNVRITWLEPDPVDETEIKWVKEGLPVSCGKYKHGYSENTVNRGMFSHLMYGEKGGGKDSLMIFPRKGETWALFKNWNISWRSDADKNRKFEYEFVEVLSEYKECVGSNVAYLAKVKGFVSVFCRIAKEGKKEIQIPPDELFMFAHMVPSFQLTGEERAGVPKGSFELDPACVPTDLPEIDAPADMKPEINTQQSGSSESSDESSDYPKPTTQSKGCTSSSKAESKASPEVIIIEENSASEPLQIPDTEFFNFDEAKSPTSFQVDQIWSLYCPEDGLPKYYAQIKKIDLTPVFKLHTSWLEVHPQQQSDLIQWHDEEMPTSVGRFKVMNEDREVYTSFDAFSHLSNVTPGGKKNEYVISPKQGEVWAMYKNWTAEMNCSDLDNCDYDFVEVLSTEVGMQIGVILLERVNGYITVYKTQMVGKIPFTKVIPSSELLRFSHRIPSFMLTSEKGGTLKGFFELDACALPARYLSR